MKRGFHTQLNKNIAIKVLWGTMLAALLFLAACSGGPDFDEPPEIIYGEDPCDRCLMIINEARYAAAYVTKSGETRRFDDIGGMAAYQNEVSEEIAVYWVHDFETEEWLLAKDAYFVESNQQTPMGFGILAFKDQDQAARWVGENSGSIKSFDDLFE